jgi:cellulose synthase/poly-beta-1,6-N-acetylglucosamine synthase-like glycosyltransferase
LIEETTNAIPYTFFFNQDYKGIIEILVADGNSIDNTVPILKEFQNRKIKNRKIKILSNPKKNTSIGRNICLFNATGKYSLNFSGHMFLEKPDTITNLVKEIENQPEHVIAVGTNPSSPKQENFIQKISSIIFKSFLAGANNLYQNKKTSGKTFVKGLAIGMYRTKTLQNEKGFDPKFWVNQDSELHYRLTLKGYKILLMPEIDIIQIKRISLKKLVKQIFRYGRGIMLRFYKFPNSLHPLQFIPAAFVIYCLFALISFINFTLISKLFIFGILLYILVGFLSALAVTRNLFYVLVSPIFYFITHMAYGIGTLVGVVSPQIKTEGEEN